MQKYQVCLLQKDKKERMYKCSKERRGRERRGEERRGEERRGEERRGEERRGEERRGEERRGEERRGEERRGEERRGKGRDLNRFELVAGQFTCNIGRPKYIEEITSIFCWQ